MVYCVNIVTHEGKIFNREDIKEYIFMKIIKAKSKIFLKSESSPKQPKLDYSQSNLDSLNLYDTLYCLEKKYAEYQLLFSVLYLLHIVDVSDILKVDLQDINDKSVTSPVKDLIVVTIQRVRNDIVDHTKKELHHKKQKRILLYLDSLEPKFTIHDFNPTVTQLKILDADLKHHEELAENTRNNNNNNGNGNGNNNNNGNGNGNNNNNNNNGNCSRPPIINHNVTGNNIDGPIFYTDELHFNSKYVPLRLIEEIFAFKISKEILMQLNDGVQKMYNSLKRRLVKLALNMRRVTNIQIRDFKMQVLKSTRLHPIIKSNANINRDIGKQIPGLKEEYNIDIDTLKQVFESHDMYDIDYRVHNSNSNRISNNVLDLHVYPYKLAIFKEKCEIEMVDFFKYLVHLEEDIFKYIIPITIYIHCEYDELFLQSFIDKIHKITGRKYNIPKRQLSVKNLRADFSILVEKWNEFRSSREKMRYVLFRRLNTKHNQAHIGKSIRMVGFLKDIDVVFKHEELVNIPDKSNYIISIRQLLKFKSYNFKNDNFLYKMLEQIYDLHISKPYPDYNNRRQHNAFHILRQFFISHKFIQMVKTYNLPLYEECGFTDDMIKGILLTSYCVGLFRINEEEQSSVKFDLSTIFEPEIVDLYNEHKHDIIIIVPLLGLLSALFIKNIYIQCNIPKEIANICIVALLLGHTNFIKNQTDNLHKILFTSILVGHYVDHYRPELPHEPLTGNSSLRHNGGLLRIIRITICENNIPKYNSFRKELLDFEYKLLLATDASKTNENGPNTLNTLDSDKINNKRHNSEKTVVYKSFKKNIIHNDSKTIDGVPIPFSVSHHTSVSFELTFTQLVEQFSECDSTPTYLKIIIDMNGNNVNINENNLLHYSDKGDSASIEPLDANQFGNNMLIYDINEDLLDIYPIPLFVINEWCDGRYTDEMEMYIPKKLIFKVQLYKEDLEIELCVHKNTPESTDYTILSIENLYLVTQLNHNQSINNSALSINSQILLIENRQIPLPENKPKNKPENKPKNKPMSINNVNGGGIKRYIKLSGGSRRLIHYGPKGGKYYINKKKKNYIK